MVTSARPSAPPRRGVAACRRPGRARRLVGLAAAMAVATAASAAPAAGDDLSTSFTLLAQGGGLTIAWATGTATVDDGGTDPTFAPSTAVSLDDALPQLTVTDDRGILVGAWTVTASSGAFVHGVDNSYSVAASQGRVYVAAADLPALTTALGGDLVDMVLVSAELTAGTSDLGTAYTLLSGTTTDGTGSVVVTPRLDLTIPAGTPAGTYTATITATVS